LQVTLAYKLIQVGMGKQEKKSAVLLCQIDHPDFRKILTFDMDGHHAAFKALQVHFERMGPGGKEFS
jgi:hypothetical protein